jgi:hypothetical protein
MSTTEECKLNSPLDWERWRRQFQSTARAADLWEVVQGLEAPIQRPAEPNINSYPRSTAPQTRSQSRAAAADGQTDDSQSTVQQEPQPGPVEFANLTAAGQTSYTTAISLYERKLKAYNTQRLGIQKLIDLIN